jgi:hypothetical protein
VLDNAFYLLPELPPLLPCAAAEDAELKLSEGQQHERQQQVAAGGQVNGIKGISGIYQVLLYARYAASRCSFKNAFGSAA